MCMYVYIIFCVEKKMERRIHVHVLMRDEKEGRKNQAWSNKQQGKATQHTHMYMYVYVHACSYSVHVMHMPKPEGETARSGHLF